MRLNSFLRQFVIWGILLIPFVPLVVSTSMFFPFITGKNFLFRFLVEILLGAWIILAFRDPAYRLKFSWIVAALSVFVGIVILADFFGENITKSFWSNYERMEGLVTILHLYAYFIIAGSVFATEALWRRFFHVSIGVSIFMVLFGVLQLAGELVINQGGVRLDGTLGNATYLAVYMLFNVFLVAFWALREVRFRPKSGAIFMSGLVGFGLFAVWSFVRAGNPNIAIGPYEKGILVFSIFAIAFLSYLYAKYRNSITAHIALYSTVLIAQLAILYHTATRGATLGLIGGVFLAVLLVVFLNRESKIVRRVSMWCGVALVLSIVLVIGLRNTAFVQENPSLGRLVNISYDDAESRFLVWGMALQGFKERPILGWGQGNFSLVFNKYYDPKMYNQEPWFDRAHNVVFDWLIAAGLLGLLAYLSIYITALYHLLFSRRFRGNDPPEEQQTINKKKRNAHVQGDAQHFIFTPVGASILTGLLAAYFFQNLFVFDQVISYTLFFSVLAFVHVEAVCRRKKNDVTDVPHPKHTHKLPQTASHVVISLVIIITPFLAYTINMGGYLTNKNLLQAIAPQQGGIEKNFEFFKKALAYRSLGTSEVREQLSQFAINQAGGNASQELRREIFLLAQDEMRQQIKSTPNDARPNLFLATLLLAYGQNEEAIKVLEEAREISPRKQTIYYLLANVYLTQGNMVKALEVTRTAFNIEPENSEARQYYIIAAIYAGEDALAEELLAYFGDDIPTNSLYINAYVNRGMYDKAATIWEKRIEKNAGDLQSYISLAAAYIELGRKDDAVAQVRKAIEIDPRYKEQGEQLIQNILNGKTPERQ